MMGSHRDIAEDLNKYVQSMESDKFHYQFTWQAVS